MEQAYLPGTVRQRIQELIKERKITQAELATEIGMAESSLSRFLSEKTDKIGDEYIIKIADFLGVSTDFILGQTDFPELRNYDIRACLISRRVWIGEWIFCPARQKSAGILTAGKDF